MDCLAILNSGNYAFAICNQLERKGYVFQVVSTPCHIAKGGCGHCIKFPYEYLDLLINECKINRMPVLEVYTITPLFSKNRYDKIY